MRNPRWVEFAILIRRVADHVVHSAMGKRVSVHARQRARTAAAKLYFVSLSYLQRYRTFHHRLAQIGPCIRHTGQVRPRPGDKFRPDFLLYLESSAEM